MTDMTPEQKALREAVIDSLQNAFVKHGSISWLVLADAAIAVVLERAAEVAGDDGHSHACNCEYCYGREHAAAAIRALIPASSAAPSQTGG